MHLSKYQLVQIVNTFALIVMVMVKSIIYILGLLAFIGIVVKLLLFLMALFITIFKSAATRCAPVFQVGHR